MKSKMLLLAILTIGLASCGSDGLSPVSNKVNGPLGNFYEIVDKNYKLKENQLSIEFKRIAEGGPTDASWSTRPTFVAELLDKDGNVIASESTDVVWSREQLEAVFSLGEGESSSITFKFEDVEGATQFKVSSKWENKEEEEKSEDEGNIIGYCDIEEIGGSNSNFQLSNVILPSQLKGKVEIINAEKSVSNYGFPAMEITFKLLKTVSTSALSSPAGQMWIIGVGQTEQGVDVKELLPSYREWRSGDSDGNEFKTFLEGEPGETITLEFTGDKDNSNDVAADLAIVR